MHKHIIVILDNIRSTFNVGSILRTSDGAGVTKLYLCGITPTPDHPKIKKTALGAEDYVKWEHHKNILEVINKLRKEGYTIVCVEQSEKAVDYKEYEYPKKVAFVFGNEISGVSEYIMEDSDAIIDIEMHGKKNSLNVATTVGIILYK
ncbi:MAG: RNA methyltransferase [Candidatus Dojkabacteria bacterium]